MKANKIQRKLRYVDTFLGVFPCDRIPKTSKYAYSMIINTDNHRLPGSHWTAIIIRGQSMYFFDSFGRNFNNNSFPLDFITNMTKLSHNKVVRFNNKVLQSFSSNTCGLYCIYLILKSITVNPINIFRNFSENLKLNDRKIVRLVN